MYWIHCTGLLHVIMTFIINCSVAEHRAYRGKVGMLMPQKILTAGTESIELHNQQYGTWHIAWFVSGIRRRLPAMITCFVILVQLDLYAALFREPTFGTPIETFTAHINQCA